MSGTRYKNYEECIRDGLIPRELAINMFGRQLTAEEKAHYTIPSSEPEFSAFTEITLLKAKVSILESKLKRAEDTMCERCNNSEKDASDYVTSESPEFIKTYDGVYFKTREVYSYTVIENPMKDGEYVVSGVIKGKAFWVERFKAKHDAEEFLEDLLQNVTE